MTAESYPIPAEALLQHRGFVSALARSLTRDEHAAEDLVQETWLEALKRPPRSAEGLRGWLARVTTSRARNAARGEDRRTAREHYAARAELDESDEHTRERVRLQHRVVEAVLALPEPYRTVVLQRYDQGLDSAEIAAKRGVPAGTIRSQLSRAHGMLREKLDHEFDGSRAAWLVPLAALGAPRGAAIAGSKLALAMAGVLVIAATYVAILARPEASAAPELSNEFAFSPTEAADPGTASGLDASSAAASSRRPVEQDTARVLASNPGINDLERQELAELMVLGQQVQRALRERLLVPDMQAAEVVALLERVPDAQVARLLPYGRIEEDIDGQLLGISGAGAYWSFATKSNDYEREPDLALGGDDFSTRGYGGTAGWIHDLGRIDLAEVRADPLSPPRGDPWTRRAWSLSWEDASTDGRSLDWSLVDRAKEHGLQPDAPAEPGHTYLLRKMMPGEHDLLAAFTVIARVEYGYTIAGRVLHRWPLPEGSLRGASPSRFPALELPVAPEWMKSMDVPTLLELSHRIRTAGSAKLFAVPQELAQRFPDSIALEDRGLARMLHRFRHGAVTAGREAGAFFTFLTRSSVFDGSDDLRFEQDRLSVSFRGAIVDLGELDFGQVERTGSIPSAELSALDRSRYEVLESVRHANAPEEFAGRRAFAAGDEERVQALALPHSVHAVVGHTYLIRSVVQKKHDVLVAFAIVDSDEHGIWIRWRLLRSWPM